MSTWTYGRYELLRVVRNRQGFIFSLVFPVIMYIVLAAPNRNNHNFGGDANNHTGLFAPQYYMVGLLAFGAMVAVLSGGARIAAERVIGWNRQLKLTPLSTRSYLRVKVATGYFMALISMALLYVLGISFGVRLSFGSWVEMTALIVVALIPFAGLGIAGGHLLNDDAAGPALGGAVSLFAFLGGSYFPITGGGVFVHICQLLPSYWLVQAGHIGLGSHKPWGVEAWAVIAIWSVASALFAAWAFKRDTRKAG